MVRNPKNEKLYNEARMLRKSGLSYRAISKLCNTSKSNISLWCRDIILSPEQQDKLNVNRSNILKLCSARLHEKRRNEIEEVVRLAKKEINLKEINKISFLIAGSMLYWGEGCKSVGLSITNSDERVIMFMIRWLEKILHINVKNQIKAHLHIHIGDNDQEIKEYWSKITGIPLSNFGKSFVKQEGTGHRKNILPHGIMRIRVYGKGMEDLRHRIMAWVDEIYRIAIK